MTYNDHLPAPKRKRLEQALRNGGEPAALAERFGVNIDTIYKNRARLAGREYGDAAPGAVTIARLCFCAGCIAPSREGSNFCGAHDPIALQARRFAAMPEATRRKLLGVRA